MLFFQKNTLFKIASGLFLLMFLVVPHSSFAAHTWTTRHPGGVPGQPWSMVASDDDGSNLIVGYAEDGQIFTSTDGGVNWTERLPAGAGTFSWKTAASDADGSFLAVGMDFGRLYTSSNGGVDWTERQPNGNQDLHWSSIGIDDDGSHLIVSTSDGRLYTSSNSGVNWTERQPQGNVDLYWWRVAIDADGSNMIAAVSGGRLYTSSNGGANWTERQPAGAADLSWASVASDDDGSNLVVAVSFGRLYTSSNGGVDWTERQPAGNNTFDWSAVASDADGSHLLAGIYGGRVYLSTNSGVDWAEVQPGGAFNLAWIAFDSDSDGSNFITAAQNGAIYIGVDAVSNSAPTATVSAPGQINATNHILYTVTVADADLDQTSLTVEHSLDNSTWASSTFYSATPLYGSISSSVGSITTIETDATSSVAIQITWNAGADLPNTDDSTVYIRVTPYDGTVYGTAATSTVFSVDTATPTAPGALVFSAATVSSVTLTLPGTLATDTNFLNYKIYYDTSAGITTADSAFTSSDDSDLGSRTFNSTTETTVSSLTANTTYYLKLYAFDLFGNSTSSAEISAATSAVSSSSAAPASTAIFVVVSFGGGNSVSWEAWEREQQIIKIQNKLNELFVKLANLGFAVPTAPQTVAPQSPPSFTCDARGLFTRTLRPGMSGEDVRSLQRYLNCRGFLVAKSGPGSTGQETTTFGLGTQGALIRFQEAFAETILTPNNLPKGTGIFGSATRAFVESTQ